MFQRIFTSNQLSRFFQIAIMINITGLLSDIIVYRYFPDYTLLKLINENLSNLSISIVCLIIVSQALILFVSHHQQFITRYKLIAIATTACICTFFVFLLTIDNDIQESFIIFCSSTSRSDRSSKVIITLVTIFILLILDFYRTIHKPDEVNDVSIPDMLRSTFKLVVKKYLLIFISVFGIIHLKKLHKFAFTMIQDGESYLFFDFEILEIVIPIAWFAAITYYLYQRFHQKKDSNHNNQIQS